MAFDTLTRALRERLAALTRRVSLPLYSILLFGFAVLGLGLIIWSSRRTEESHLAQIPRTTVDKMLPNLAFLTGGSLVDGNRVEVLQNGDGFFPRLLDDIRGATENIHYETYVWWTGDICETFGEAFAAKAREGVTVRLLLDAQGTLSMDPELVALMEEAGVDIGYFHPVSLKTAGRVNTRDHRKLAVIDGRTAYFMGHGLAAEWDGDARNTDEYRDTAVRIEGPVVNEAQAVFLRNWLQVTDEIELDEEYFPDLPDVGPSLIHVAASAPGGAISDVELLYKLAIISAEEEILIQNPYFAPSKEIMQRLIEAAARGVRVRIMLPSINDSQLVQHASQNYYPAILDSDIELWHYDKTFAHQKVMVVDRRWSHVGSTNFDHRSLQINHEVSVGIIDSEVADELVAAFEDDLRYSSRVTRETWKRRPLVKRALDRVALLIRDQL